MRGKIQILCLPAPNCQKGGKKNVSKKPLKIRSAVNVSILR